MPNKQTNKQTNKADKTLKYKIVQLEEVVKNLSMENERLTKDLEKANEELKRKLHELSVLYEVSNSISYTLDYKQLFTLIKDSLYKVVNYDVCASILLFGERGELLIRTAKPVSKEFIEQVESNVESAINSLTSSGVPKERIKVVLETELQSNKEKEMLTKVQSFFNVPLIVKDIPIGILNVSSGKESAFSREDIKLLYALANQAAGAVERLRAVIAAEKSKMEAMVESMAEGVIMTDEKGKLVVINPAAKSLLGFRPDENVTGEQLIKPFKEVGKGELFAKGISFAEEEEEEEEEEASTEINIAKPEPRTLYATQALVKSTGGEKLGFVTIIRDITKEKEIDRMKTEFISTVSHELRTPLTTMKEFVSILLDEIPGKVNKDQKEYLSIVKGNIDRLSRLIAGLLDISRIEAGRVELKKTLVDISSITRNVITSLKPRADNKNIRLKTLFRTRLPSLYVDPDRIAQVFTNLIDNAIKFTPKGGSITVQANGRRKEVEVSVIDTGVGIATEDLDKVFDRFQQIDRVAGPGAKGTGLGLSITKELIQMHGGRIWAEKPPAGRGKPGKGSKFTFVLPKYGPDEIFREYLNNGLKAARNNHTALSLIVINVANFSQIKRTYGIGEGRRILKEIEEITKKNVRWPTGIDVVSRYRNNRSVTILAAADKKTALSIEDRIEKSIQGHDFGKERGMIEVVVTFGMATYPDEATDEREMVKKADVERKRVTWARS